MRLEQATINPLNDLALPWHDPIALWPDSLCTRLNGFATKELRFIEHKGRCYMLQELPAQTATENFRLLRTLADFGLPVVKPVLIVLDRDEHHPDLPAVLVTRLPKGSVPLNAILSDPDSTGKLEALAEALAVLTAHLHLAGYHWRTDAQPSIIVRAEGGQYDAMLMHPVDGFLTDRPDDLLRAMDLDILARALTASWPEVNDFEAALRPVETTNAMMRAYHRIWQRIAQSRSMVGCESTLNQAEEDPSSGLEGLLAEGPGEEHHRLALHHLTGLDVSEAKSAHLLKDILRYHAWLEFSSGRKWPRLLAANRWMNEIFLPAIKQLPALTH